MVDNVFGILRDELNNPNCGSLKLRSKVFTYKTGAVNSINKTNPNNSAMIKYASC